MNSKFGLGVVTAFAVALGTFVFGGQAQAQCSSTYGDITADDNINVADVQCMLVAVLEILTGGSATDAACLEVSATEADLTCEGSLNVTDVQVQIALVLGSTLAPAVDANENSCVDACEVQCGDLSCDEALGESCVNCSLDCGICPDPCCEAHGSAGCAEPDVEACVCDTSSFCCDILWDATCAELAVEFCDPVCSTGSCALAGELTCGSSLIGTTASAPSLLDDYACSSASTTDGPERTYLFQPETTTTAEFAVSGAEGVTVNLYVLEDGCDPEECVGGGTPQAVTTFFAGVSYYVVVDGPAATAGEFELSVTCPDDCDFEALCGADECGKVSCAGTSFECGTCSGGDVCVAGVCSAPSGPGCPGSGDCFEDNGTTGCSDVTCCELICTGDPFCCDNSWDDLCAESAVFLCDGGMPPTTFETCPGSTSCSSEATSPGCSDTACCNAVCSEDSFCCEVEWDDLCVIQAGDICF